MNENLKKRIIGVIILVIFSIIIAPMLFTGSGQKKLKFAEIKDQDDIKFKYIDKVEVLDNKKLSKEKKLNISVEEKVIKDIKNIENSSKQKRNWVIRVGTFTERSNALAQLKKLKEGKYQSYIIKLNKNSKIFYAVNVGPFFSAAKSKKVFLNLTKNNTFKSSYIIESNYKK